jgi:hypothetical protein
MATKKQLKTMADLLVSAQHYANEVGLPYVMCFEGLDTIFHNTTPRHARAILGDTLELIDKIQEEVLNDKAARLTCLPPKDDDDTAGK